MLIYELRTDRYSGQVGFLDVVLGPPVRGHPVKVVIGVGLLASPFREELEPFDSVHGILEVLHTVCQI